MKVGLVGLGYWGSKILRNLVTMLGPASVVGVDDNPLRIESARRQCPGLATADSIDVLLDDPGVEAVLLATPVETHAALAERVLMANRHVFIEKPMALCTTDAERLASLAQDRGLALVVGHTFLFSPRVKMLHDLLHAGDLGRIHYMTSDRLNLGLHRSDANVIWDLAPHDLSILCHLMDEFPVSVHASAQSVLRDGIPDVAFITLTFPSGAIASVNVSWLAPRKVRNTVVVGDRGMIVYDDTQADEPIKIFDRGVETPDSPDFGENQLTYRYGATVAPHVSADEPLAIELRHFLECVQRNEPTGRDAWFGVEIVRILEAADRSWRLGGIPVPVRAEHAEVLAPSLVA